MNSNKHQEWSLWNDNSIQFPRLIFECYSVLTDEQINELCTSMDLSTSDLLDLFDRANRQWEDIAGAFE